MLEEPGTEDDFSVFKTKYSTVLVNFLNDKKHSETLLNEGYKLGREAIANNIPILNIAAIHQDCVVTYLEQMETNEHLMISEKANNFFEEILGSFQMMETNFREAITLLNQRSLEFAGKMRELHHSLKEKEALLREIYHRVKNNLQVVSSLLNLQAEAATEPAAQDVLIVSSARVKSMSLIHEMLYQTDNLAKIEMQGYLDNLFKYLFNIYDVKHVKLITDIDNISLSIDTSIPCGLLINEMMSNTLKHAFPWERPGEITFSFKRKNGNIVLIMSDNGVGISPQIDILKTPSLGMRLIQNLAKQLNGEIVLDRAQGTTFTLVFTGDK